MVQYMSRKLLRPKTTAAMPASRMRGDRRETSSHRSRAAVLLIALVEEVRQRRGIALLEGKAAVRNGASASMVTTHGESEVAKLFARNGPSG